MSRYSRPSLQVLGAAGTVTVSCYLIKAVQRHILVDCGLFQGFKNLREQNREPLPLRFATASAAKVVSTDTIVHPSNAIGTASSLRDTIHSAAATLDLPLGGSSKVGTLRTP